MALMGNIKIDVTKIEKGRLYKGKKGTYLNLTIAIADEPDDYGNDITVWQEQTKAERENRDHRNFLGSSGKIFWRSRPEVTEPDSGGVDSNTYDDAPDSDTIPF